MKGRVWPAPPQRARRRHIAVGFLEGARTECGIVITPEVLIATSTTAARLVCARCRARSNPAQLTFGGTP